MPGNDRSRSNWSSENSLVATHPPHDPYRRANGTNRSGPDHNHPQNHQRSLKDIAAETGTPVEALAAAARKAGIRVQHGISSRAHPLATFGGPGAFPRTSGTSSHTRAPSSASDGSSPSPASPASTTQPASSASGTPSSPARSASSRPPSAPPSCAQDQTGDSH
jgi:hypothetical protein